MWTRLQKFSAWRRSKPEYPPNRHYLDKYNTIQPLAGKITFGIAQVLILGAIINEKLRPVYPENYISGRILVNAETYKPMPVGRDRLPDGETAVPNEKIVIDLPYFTQTPNQPPNKLSNPNKPPNRLSNLNKFRTPDKSRTSKNGYVKLQDHVNYGYGYQDHTS